MEVWKTPERDKWPLLRELWSIPGEVILIYLGGPCYTPHLLDNFYINLPIDESSFEWLVDHKDAHRFMQSRNEDHLMTTFHV
jgi:hypothetical protein